MQAVSVAKQLIGLTAPYTKLVKAYPPRNRLALAHRFSAPPHSPLRAWIYVLCTSRPTPECQVSHLLGSLGLSYAPALAFGYAISTILDVRVSIPRAWFTTVLQPQCGATYTESGWYGYSLHQRLENKRHAFSAMYMHRKHEPRNHTANSTEPLTLCWYLKLSSALASRRILCQLRPWAHVKRSRPGQDSCCG